MKAKHISRLIMMGSLIFLLISQWTANAVTPSEKETSECRKYLDIMKYSQAFAVCTEAAKAGDPDAQLGLSLMYLNGWGVSQNEDEAIRLLIAAADQRYPPAQYALASSYMTGSGVPKDRTKALMLLRQSAEQGFILGQTILGSAYESGYEPLGIEKDTNRAIGWYSKAAEQFEACHYELGRIYFSGEDVEKDLVKAAHHLEKAARAGMPKAQTLLGLIYNEGEGVPKDNVQAYAWISIAEKGKEPLAIQILPALSKEMSAAERDQAKAMANEIMANSDIDVTLLCQIYGQFCDR
ncbi:MAG: tetratricopeptide repeat protein [Desulfuromonadales bacterium]|jgi:uncharacterized protein